MRLSHVLLLFGWLALFGPARAQLAVVTTFGGTTNQTTTSFQVQDKWELQWNCPDTITVTVLAPDGTAVSGVSAKGTGTIFMGKGGKYSLQVTKAPGSSEQWDITISQVGAATKTDFALTPASTPVNTAANPTPTPTAAPAPMPAPTPATTPSSGNLTEQQAHAIVVIKGDVAEGTGFLVHGPDGPAVVTNLHVLSANPNVKILTTTGEQITTNTGTPITILSYKGATDRDLAMISIKDGAFTYLTPSTDITTTVQPGDEVITPGNSEGGDVVLNTDGKVLGIGPDRVEFDNPIYHGNSGGPVFHVKSGTVIGIVTEAMKVDVANELDKASFANRDSAIGNSMRYFGLRLDTAKNWETYDWNRFQVETTFLDQFETLNRNLDSYLNAPDDSKPEDIIWENDEKITAANNGYFKDAAGADAAQQMDGVRQWLSDMYDIVNTNMDAIQDPRNFYSFDRQRAKDALAYRKALKAELDSRSENISQLASMPRKNK